MPKIRFNCSQIKLHCKRPDKKLRAEEDIFRKTTDRACGSTKKWHTIETLIEATDNEINKKEAHKKRTKYSNLLEGKQ